MFVTPSLYVVTVSFIAWLSLLIFYAWGKYQADDEVKEDAIEKTILYLISEGYVKYSRDQNGEIELHKFDDEN